MCTSCKQIKPLSEFYKNKARYDGLENRCKDCTKARNKEYREEHKEYFKQKKAEHYQNHKDEKREKVKEFRKKAMENSELDIDYSTIHQYIKRHKASQKYCEICKKDKKLELASIGHTYTRNPEDWMWLCRECHIEFDRPKPSRNFDEEEQKTIDSIKLLQHLGIVKKEKPSNCPECGTKLHECGTNPERLLYLCNNCGYKIKQEEKPSSICTLKEQRECYSYKTMFCLSPKITTCMHGKTELEKEKWQKELKEK